MIKGDSNNDVDESYYGEGTNDDGDNDDAKGCIFGDNSDNDDGNQNVVNKLNDHYNDKAGADGDKIDDYGDVDSNNDWYGDGEDDDNDVRIFLLL